MCKRGPRRIRSPAQACTLSRYYSPLYRWSFPGDAPDFAGIRPEFIVAQRRGQSLKALVLKQPSSLQTALPQRLKVLVQVLHSVRVGSNAVRFIPVVLEFLRNSRHFSKRVKGTPVRGNVCLVCVLAGDLCVFVPRPFPHPLLLVSDFVLAP